MTTKSILILEDDPNIRGLLTTVFTNAGYIASAVPDGASGLTLASDGGFTVILLDIMMPRIDGLEFLKQIKQLQPKNPNGPIIVYTSQAQDTIKQACLASGATAFLEKDADDITTLPQTIEGILQQHALQNTN
jgi:two-component system response regulator ResD